MSKNIRTMSSRRIIGDIISHIVLFVLSIIWVLPIAWLVITSLRIEKGTYLGYFWPKGFSFDNYIRLFTDTKQFFFLRWFGNTLIVAVFTCLISTFFVLSTSYTMSRLRFSYRKRFMKIAMTLGLFPGFMSMVAIYYILKGFGITQSLLALILVYSGSAGLGFFIAKGFFDTIPKALDEAAKIDGATNWQVFTKLTIPFSKPIIVYTILTSFLAPWGDFIFASVIMGDNYKNYTVSVGLWMMLEREFINQWFTRFAAGAVVVSIPISILFVYMQKYYVGGVTGGSVKG